MLHEEFISLPPPSLSLVVSPRERDREAHLCFPATPIPGSQAWADRVTPGSNPSLGDPIGQGASLLLRVKCLATKFHRSIDEARKEARKETRKERRKERQNETNEEFIPPHPLSLPFKVVATQAPSREPGHQARGVGGSSRIGKHFLSFPATPIPGSQGWIKHRVPVTGTTGPSGLRLLENTRQPTGNKNNTNRRRKDMKQKTRRRIRRKRRRREGRT